MARLNAAVAALADATLQTKLRALGAEPASPDRNTPERLAVFLAAEREKWGAIIRKAHIHLELVRLWHKADYTGPRQDVRG